MTIITSVDQLYIFRKTGNVVGIQEWTDTETSSATSGGSGFVYQGTGSLSGSSTTISTQSTQNLRLFIRKDDGPEFELTVSKPDFGFREGHRATVIYAGDEASGTGRPAALINHDTGKKQIWARNIELLVPGQSSQVGKELGCIMVFVAPIAVQVGYMLLFGKFNDVYRFTHDSYGGFSFSAFFPAFLTFCYMMFRRVRSGGRSGKLKQEITQRIEAEIQNAIASEGGSTRAT